MIFFQMKKSDFWPENWKGWSHNIETFHKEKSGVLEKKPRKFFFVAATLHAQIGSVRSNQS